MVRQPVPAHRAEVAHEAPRITAPSPAGSDEGIANNDEGEEDRQSDGTRHVAT